MSTLFDDAWASWTTSPDVGETDEKEGLHKVGQRQSIDSMFDDAFEDWKQDRDPRAPTTDAPSTTQSSIITTALPLRRERADKDGTDHAPDDMSMNNQLQGDQIDPVPAFDCGEGGIPLDQFPDCVRAEVEHVLCPICRFVCRLPVRIDNGCGYVDDCKHVFCDTCIRAWLSTNDTCPLFRRFSRSDHLVQETGLQTMLKTLRKASHLNLDERKDRHHGRWSVETKLDVLALWETNWAAVKKQYPHLSYTTADYWRKNLNRVFERQPGSGRRQVFSEEEEHELAEALRQEVDEGGFIPYPNLKAKALAWTDKDNPAHQNFTATWTWARRFCKEHDLTLLIAHPLDIDFLGEGQIPGKSTSGSALSGGTVFPCRPAR
jgi:hypothetical protein